LTVFFSDLFSQTVPADFIKPIDYPVTQYSYYFNSGGTLYDVRDFSVVKENFPEGNMKIIGQDTIMIHGSGYGAKKFSIFDKNMNLVNSYIVDGDISREWDYSIFMKDNDLWRKDINIRTGKTYNERKITELGLFRPRYWAYSNWYGDNMIFCFLNKKGVYLLDTKTGAIEEIISDIWFSRGDYFYGSPSGKLIEYNNRGGQAPKFMNLQDESISQMDKSIGVTYWFNDDVIAYFENRNTLRIQSIKDSQAFYDIELLK